MKLPNQYSLAELKALSIKHAKPTTEEGVFLLNGIVQEINNRVEEHGALQGARVESRPFKRVVHHGYDIAFKFFNHSR